MPVLIAIGLVAGTVAALLFGSIVSGSMLALLLFYLAPLPIMITGLGWRHIAAAIACVLATLLVAMSLSPWHGLIFFLAVGFPGWWLAYLALLARDDEGVTAWYPIERLVVWIGGLGILFSVTAVVGLFGLDYDSYQTNLRNGIETGLRLQYGIPRDQPVRLPGMDDVTPVVTFLAQVAAATSAVVWTVITAGNLYLAARIVRMSGLLVRPWPAIHSLSLPKWVGMAAVAMVLLGMSGGMAGHIGNIAFGVIFALFFLAGLALVHDLSRNSTMRTLMLSALYTSIAVFGLPVLLVGLAGLADSLFGLRQRFAGQNPLN